jgi:hypothetical protein
VFALIQIGDSSTLFNNFWVKSCILFVFVDFLKQ